MSDHSPPFGRATTDTKTPTSSASLGTGSRRHYALQYLEQFNYPVELKTIAAYVAAALTGISVESVGDDERERIAIRLHHIDIPKLVTGGIVEYDPESRMAVCTGAVGCLDRYADSSDHSRWSDVA